MMVYLARVASVFVVFVCFWFACWVCLVVGFVLLLWLDVACLLF